jgi:hypothetical protein
MTQLLVGTHMSAIALFLRLPITALEGLRSAAVPKKRIFGGVRDDMPNYLSRHARPIAEYRWSGYVIATVLAYLKDLGIDLMRSGYQDLANYLSKSRGVTAHVLSNDQRVQYSNALRGAFPEEELCAYYNQFNATSDTDAGRPMLDGIIVLRDALNAIDAESVVLVTIG